MCDIDRSAITQVARVALQALQGRPISASLSLSEKNNRAEDCD
ncbi:hypothetical protein [Synechococcus sp. M16CYN]